MKRTDNRGIALLVTVFTLTLVSALAAAVVLTTSSEAAIASNFRTAQQALYAANAAAEWTIAEVAAASNWASIAGGSQPSSFVDGQPDGVRRLSSGTIVDLAGVVLGSPGWRLYAYGALNDLVAGPDTTSQFYITALVAPGSSADRLRVRAVAYGPRAARQVVDVGIIRGAAGVRVETWEAVR